MQTSEVPGGDGDVAIIGAGSIGVSFAIVLARSGQQVRLFDPSEERRSLVPGELARRLDTLAAHGLLDESAEVILGRASVCETLAESVSRASFVIECAPERLEVKQAVFAEVAAAAPADAVLVSASSAIPISNVVAQFDYRDRCLVAHPGNPPHLIPMVELVPASFTAPRAIETARDLFAKAGMRPVLVNKEIEGFVFNRLQGALLREAYCLVRDGVASVEDVDVVVRHGLGLRWSIIGPFETADLNTRGGIESHAMKLGPAYFRMGAQRGQNDPWTPALVAKVVSQRRALLPMEEWESRVAWRDSHLMALAKHRRENPTGT
jgi:3-hydroxyacyl-CoA dehydrogenase